ncbi:Protein FAM210B, mitochondrial [Larimichthys crocea]|uniref:Uncharacterized protein n=1 Tax=Larimichthys crocea TaxID=215358 RepID=A0ACD3RIV6_LARCR|nr:Protein FAM210B, mitochondrial [Larimichthys crocea]
MFLCRTGRLPAAAALDQAFKSTGSFLVQVKANRLRDVTLTLRKDYMSQGRRCFCVSVHDSTRAHLKKQQPDPQPVQNWDTSSGFVISDWVHPSKKAQSDASKSDIIRQLLHANTCYSNRGELPVGDVLFTGNWRVSSRHCSTRTMHTTATSTKKRDTGEEQTADNNKGEEQHLKDASMTSSSTANAPGEPEPEGGKLNKTQQLKKVFKEYGAVGVSFHICISLMSLGMFYLLISSGIDMAAVLCKVGFSEAVVRSKMAAGDEHICLGLRHPQALRSSSHQHHSGVGASHRALLQKDWSL